VEDFMSSWPEPPDLQKSEETRGGQRCFRFTVVPGPHERRIVHVHGGGFTSGSGGTYGALLGALAESCRAEVFSCDYRLAPEHPYPAGLEDVSSALTDLLDDGRAATTAVVADSAGSALALAAVQALPAGLRPAAMVFYSPLVDLASDGGSLEDNGATDTMFSLGQLQSIRRAYARGVDLNDPALSPCFSDLTGMPPTLIFAGEGEVLRDNAVRLDEQLRRAGVPSDLRIVSEVPHAWPTFGVSVPESAQAIRDTARFILDRVPRPAGLS
jgi:epsilon-lactone hydrolase